jgi:DNA modification methylase
MISLTLLHGHILEALAALPAESVHCVVTSPPYWGLRDYGLEPVIWGGAAGCQHEWGDRVKPGNYNWADKIKSTGNLDHGHQKSANANRSSFCRLCGAWRGSYGLEPHHDCLGWATGQPCGQCYICHTVQIFREVRRVLRKDGTLWLNIGDSYAGSGKGIGTDHGKAVFTDKDIVKTDWKNIHLKPKDLCGIPFRLALALQADGWWLRSDIIWNKPNPMPESCTDRPTRSHEYIFLLTKSANYFWDQEVVREPHLAVSLKRIEYGLRHNHPDKIGIGIPPVNTNRMGERFCHPSGRNLRSVWTIVTQPFPGAHFATFPTKIVEICIKAGTSEKGCCPQCSAPWERVVEKKGGTIGKSWHPHVADKIEGQSQKGIYPGGGLEASQDKNGNYYLINFLGWRATCSCQAGEPTSCTILDPFSGSGTTLLVAAKMGCQAIGCELSADYVEMSRQRLQAEMGMLAEIEVVHLT